MELGVERLILPAVPSVLNTWTTSFGFSEMTASERLEFLRYTFLDFQGTVMCQKLLKKYPSAEASLLRGMVEPHNHCRKIRTNRCYIQPKIYFCMCHFAEIQHKACDGFDGGDVNIDLDGHSAVSEVYQAEQIEQSEIVDQGYVEYVLPLFCFTP